MITEICVPMKYPNEFLIQQYWMRKNLEAGMKVMDIELTTFMDRAFNGEFDYPVCI